MPPTEYLFLLTLWRASRQPKAGASELPTQSKLYAFPHRSLKLIEQFEIRKLQGILIRNISGWICQFLLFYLGVKMQKNICFSITVISHVSAVPQIIRYPPRIYFK